ncbi:putative carbohydrate-binding protein [Phytophthora cinnamomi]|uniref:putative carbohydrate-binding protein n=1 Tax=Phytophthora cinnamomi TaxID=4785 RepID=UPI00355A3A6E|nr:putative carbohydrate-binding protein [Phytophthora cinnamomi]
MRTVATVSTDDLVNSLLNSVTSTTSSPSTSTSTSTSTTSNSSTDSATSAPSSASASSSTSAPASASNNAASSSNNAHASTPFTEAPTATKTPSTDASEAQTSGSSHTGSEATTTSSDGGSNGAALSIGIAVGVLALVVATLLFLRSRKKRSQKTQESAWSPPAGATCLAVPADRGFKQEHELGMPEMSIELAPGQLGLSKGLDMSYASSRSSANSNQYNPSVASSSDGSVFNTQGGVSPTFSSRKMASYSYQYRESEEAAGAKSNNSTTFHLTGLIGNGATGSGRGGATPKRAPGGRKLSAPDEYAELATTTNAQPKVDMSAHDKAPQVMQADFRQSSNMEISMGPSTAADNQSFLAPLPTRAAPGSKTQARAPSEVRASEVSMGPDSPVGGKRTGSVYDSIPNLTGEKMAASYRSSEDPREMSTASFLSESSISSTSTRDSVATSARSSAYVSSMPLLQQLSSADDSDYGDDMSSDRSSDSANAQRPGSLIALNLEAKDGCSEIAI